MNRNEEVPFADISTDPAGEFPQPVDPAQLTELLTDQDWDLGLLQGDEMRVSRGRGSGREEFVTATSNIDSIEQDVGA